MLPVVRVQSACFSLLLTNFNVVLRSKLLNFTIIFAHVRAIVTRPLILSKASTVLSICNVYIKDCKTNVFERKHERG